MLWDVLKRIFRSAVTGAAEAPEAPLVVAESLEEGISRHQSGDLAAAEAIYRRILAQDPTHPGAAHSLGVLLAQHRKYAEAERFLRSATMLEPGNPTYIFNLGNAVKAQGRLDEAIELYLRSIDLGPSAEAHVGLGNALQAQRKFDWCLEHYAQAIRLQPDHVDAHYNFGCACQALGRLDEAIAYYRKTISLAPAHVLAHSNLVFALDMSPAESPASQLAARKEWDARHAAHLLGPQVFGNPADPDRRLRIGYVSADIREHSAVVVFGAMLAEFDRACFDVFVYANAILEDAITRRFKQGVTGWRNIFGTPDDDVAAMIREDGIDILVDLSGHSGGNRLLVFARKPAPIQVTAWGYATGTGLGAMDVFFADPVVLPAEEMQLYVERIRYLPNIIGSYFPREFPPVAPLPALSTDGVTFGSFNRLVKISDQAFEIWGRVLNAVPRSRMVMKVSELDYPSSREKVIEHFSRAGVDPQRITLLGGTPWFEHMSAYNQVDIALDPFPEGGGVTTMEGLIMGVPVIALRWPTIAGRTSASFLTTLGMTDWIAETPEQYVDIACRKARDLEALATLRSNLRGRYYACPLGDAAAYVRAVEREYRLLWREWCERQMPPP